MGLIHSWRGRFGLCVAVGAAAVGSTLAPASALAQQEGMALNRFEPAPAGDRFFGVENPYPGDSLMPHLIVYGDYAHNPLVLVREVDGEQDELGAVVEHQLHLHIGASFGLFDWAALSLSLPIAVFQQGEDPGFGSARLVSPDGAQVGDLRLGAKVRIWGEAYDPFQIGVGGYVWFPTGPSGEGSFVGDGSVRGQPQLLLGGQYEWLLWSLTAGPEFRASQEVLGTTQGTMMHWGAGLAALVGPEQQVQIGPEVNVAAVFDGLEARNTNAEGLLGIKWRFVSFMEAGLAAGPGFSTGIGTPDFRGVFSLAFTPKPKRDRDGDGIEDADDACPDVPGVESDDPAKNGCPAGADRDNDGILDAQDACPDVPGLPNDDPQQNGCPPPGDRDRDGILDAVDACPEVPGSTNADPTKNGCPADRDGDGILDAQDACPDVPGVPSTDPAKNGCPADRDGDGILDQDDACPDVPGVASPDRARNGCPADRDGDGVLDAEDACPDEPGRRDADPKKNGCPVVQITQGEVLILEQVLFDTDKATIKPVSDPLLDDVGRVLREHPELELVEIQGHTDTQGGLGHNMQLSQARADSVKSALVKRGIVAARLTSKGFGPKVPIADNKTPEGREKNRRVQFKILKRAGGGPPVTTR